MDDVNAHLKNAIASYLQRVTDYALLVTGPWGSGKTYQVLSTLRTSHNQRLYISAAGASSEEELNFRLVVASTPFLGTKFANLTEQVISGLLSRVKVDYKIKLADFAKVPKSAVVVIDDIERFAGNISVLLAVANSLVEQSDRKVILLAAENELTGHRRDLFFRTKEKVVGRQVEVAPDPLGVAKGVLYRIPLEYQKFVIENLDGLRLVFDRIGRGNLRTFKRFLFDFLAIYEGLVADSKLDSKHLLKVAQILLAFTLPARRNEINKSLIERRPDNSFTAAFIAQASSSPLSPVVALGRELPEVNIFDQTVGDDLINAFVFDGHVSPNIIERTRNDLLIGEEGGEAKPWRVLWHYLDVDDSTFQKALGEFLDQFLQRQFVLPGEVIHAFGILFELSEAGLLRYTPEQISEMAEAYSDEIVASAAFDVTLGGVMADHRHGSAYGLGFLQLENPRMSGAITYLKSKAEEKRQDDLVRRFENAFEIGMDDLNPALEILVGSDPRSSLRGVPFLQKISPTKVAGVVVYLSSETQGSLLRSIASRFAQESTTVTEIEREWIPQLIASLHKQLGDNKSDLLRRRISQMIEWYLQPLMKISNDAGGQKQ